MKWKNLYFLYTCLPVVNTFYFCLSSPFGSSSYFPLGIHDFALGKILMRISVKSPTSNFQPSVPSLDSWTLGHSWAQRMLGENNATSSTLSLQTPGSNFSFHVNISTSTQPSLLLFKSASEFYCFHLRICSQRPNQKFISHFTICYFNF
jgi:hypothetical protein